MIYYKKIIITTLHLFLLFSISFYAQTQVDSLKNLLDKSEPKQKLKILVKIGYFLLSENPSEAIIYLDQAINLAEETNNSWSKADALFNKGVAYWHLGEIEESDEYYRQAIPIYQQHKDSLSLIKVYNSQAINYQMQGNIDKAFETFLKSLDFAKKKGDRPTILNTLLNIGIMYDNNKDFENCLKYYYEALKYTDQSDRATIALLQSYMAEVYLSMDNLLLAESYLNKAIENSRAANDTKSLIWSYSSLGKIKQKNKKYTEAENYFLESLALARKTEFKLEIIHTLTDLGKFYNLIKKYNLAEKYLSEASDLAEELNSLSDLSLINKELASLNYNKGNYKKAYELRIKYKQLSDSLFIISNNEKIAEIKTKHDLKQKERETRLLINENELQKKIIISQKLIAIVVSVFAIVSIIFIWILLRNRNKILKSQNVLLLKNEEIENHRRSISDKNEELAGLNTTKDKFFSIIAHDLRNPIAAFVNLCDLLEHDYERLSEDDRKEIISQMNISSKSLMRLLENLLTWARLSSSKIEIFPEKVLINELFETTLYPHIQSAQNKKIKITLDIPESIEIKTDRFVFQTILGNLINNAIKFSNSHSEIIIKLADAKDNYLLSVIDHGIGIEESDLRNLFDLGKVTSGRGTMGEAGSGLGLVLVKELVDKLNWQIEVKSKINQGSEFIVTIPKQLNIN